MKNQNPAGILLLYHHYRRKNAPTIMEHVNSFSRYSDNKIWSINTGIGFPKKLNEIKFSAIILHYSLFGMHPFNISDKFIQYLKSNNTANKIVFFQDEYTACREKFDFINEVEIDVVYSLLDPESHNQVYLNHCSCKAVKHTLTGYVDDDLISLADRLRKQPHERSIDFGYRARPLPYFLGKGGREKTDIADNFIKHANTDDYSVDIKTAEKDRIYGPQWYHFISNCKAMIGVEAGVSVFDIEGKVKPACEKYLLDKPDAIFEEIYDSILLPWEDNIYYRTISPRIFECAAFRTCMILFEGRYNDMLKPMHHYIPLKKDFSNFNDVLNIFNNSEERDRLTENAYKDLIESGKYSYKNFIGQFDGHLETLGVQNVTSNNEIQSITEALKKGMWKNELVFYTNPYTKPIKVILKAILKPRKTIRRIRHWHASRNSAPTT